MRTSRRIGRVLPSGTMRVAQTVRDLRQAGQRVISLAEGEPDFETPSHVVEAAHNAAKAGETRYTAAAGTPELRIAAAKALKPETRTDYQPDQVIIGTGAKQLIFNALMATLDPGDEVVIPAPYWVSYPDMVAIADGQPVIVDCSVEQGFKLTAEALASAISDRTRWLMLNSPANPTGAVYSRSELQELANVVKACPQIAIMCDDIYMSILFDGVEFATMAEASPELRDRILTVNGVSKSHAMTGWRIGFAAGPSDLIEAMTKLQGQSTTNAASVSQAAALAALNGPQDFLRDRLKAYTSRRNLVAQRLAAIPGLRVHMPAGAFYHFVGCIDWNGAICPSGETLCGDLEICDYLLKSAGVAVVPGTDFGAPGYFRLCFAKSEELLVAACDSIQEAASRLKFGNRIPAAS